MFIITIEDFKLGYRNKNYLIRNSTILFKLYSLKYKINEYFIFFNSVLILILIFKGIYST